MDRFDEIITEDIKTVAVLGHVHPDGDCVGAVTAVYEYLHENFPQLSIVPFLEEPVAELSFLEEDIPVERSFSGHIFDLCIALDCSDLERAGAGKEAFSNARHTFVVDHHETDTGYGDVNVVRGEASSTCEMLYDLFDKEKISCRTAMSLYTGIIHDTGVFQYDCTSPSTLRAAADLVEKGFDFASIIRDSVVLKSYKESRVIADMVMKSVFFEEKFFLYAIADKVFQEEHGVSSKELHSVVSSLNDIRGADTVLFIYEMEDGSFKGSLRSKEHTDVSKIAVNFGGGGHKRAAGFTLNTEPEVCVSMILEMLDSGEYTA